MAYEFLADALDDGVSGRLLQIVDLISDDLADGANWKTWLPLAKNGAYNDFLAYDVVKVNFTMKPTL